MPEETEKYPRRIEKLFRPRLPAPFIVPTDYPAEKRTTCSITPILSYKSIIDHYVSQLPEIEKNTPKPEKSSFQLHMEKYHTKRNAHKLNFNKQLEEWNNPEFLLKQEKDVMKDPYRTVFIARLEYQLTEIDVSKHFARFGPIESVRIIRDTNGKSRGYGFIVFEKDSDAKTCVKELAASGLKTLPGSRTILVDMERGRIIRNWLPRRLGGGLGGRHYTKTNSNSSAAASGRRMNLLSNPYQEKKHKTHGNYGTNYGNSSYGNSSYSTNYGNSYGNAKYAPNYSSYGSGTGSGTNSGSIQESTPSDKYAKYALYSLAQRNSSSIRKR